MKKKPKDKSYKFWDRVSGWSKAETAANSTLAGWIDRRFGEYARPGDTVLDFGCGTGTLTLRMARSVCKIYGVDVSGGMLRRAELNMKDRNTKNAEFSKITDFNEMFPDGSFETVTSFNVLQYVENRGEYFEEFYRLLKPQGTLIVAVPCFGGANGLSTFFVRLLRFFRIMPKTYFFGVDEVEDEITGAGFTIVESINLSGLPEKLIVASRCV